VTVICPTSGLNPEVTHRLAQGQITHIDRVYVESDLDSLPWALVLVAIDDPVASSAAWKACRSRRIPANIADVPPECDFYFGSMHREGPVQIMVSTNGRGPRLAASLRKNIAATLPEGIGKAVENIGVLRGRLREVAPNPEQGPKRMRWMSKISDKYSWEELGDLRDEDMTNILGFWDKGTVPDIDVLKAMRGNPDVEIDVFDGSFGFSVGV
jgi:precorrin-2 dehydrogenase/sirohydrochlorin ferrochelatase